MKNTMMCRRVVSSTVCIAMVVLFVSSQVKSAYALIPAAGATAQAAPAIVGTVAGLLMMHFMKNEQTPSPHIVVSTIIKNYPKLYREVTVIFKRYCTRNTQSKFGKQVKSVSTNNFDARCVQSFIQQSIVIIHKYNLLGDVKFNSLVHSDLFPMTFYITCVVHFLAGIVPEQCSPSFLPSSPRSPLRNSGPTSAMPPSNYGQPEKQRRPYTDVDRWKCRNRTMEINQSIASIRSNIIIIRKIIDNMNPSLHEKLNTLSSMVEDADKQCIGLVDEIVKNQHEELGLDMTSDYDQNVMHAYLDDIQSRVALLASIISTEQKIIMEKNPNFASLQKSTRRVLKHIITMREGVYRQMLSSYTKYRNQPTKQQQCLDQYQLFLKQLQSFEKEAEKTYSLFLESPMDKTSFTRFQISIDKILEKSVRVITDFKKFKDRCAQEVRSKKTNQSIFTV